MHWGQTPSDHLEAYYATLLQEQQRQHEQDLQALRAEQQQQRPKMKTSDFGDADGADSAGDRGHADGLRALQTTDTAVATDPPEVRFDMLINFFVNK